MLEKAPPLPEGVQSEQELSEKIRKAAQGHRIQLGASMGYGLTIHEGEYCMVLMAPRPKAVTPTVLAQMNAIAAQVNLRLVVEDDCGDVVPENETEDQAATAPSPANG